MCSTTQALVLFLTQLWGNSLGVGGGGGGGEMERVWTFPSAIMPPGDDTESEEVPQ